jgi:hypothetical protein
VSRHQSYSLRSRVDGVTRTLAFEPVLPVPSKIFGMRL